MDIRFEQLQLIPKNVLPHKFEEVGVYKNVTVQILRCPHCGEISVGWMKQPNTEVVYEKEEDDAS